ncbi:MAG TPA: hypothetical protein VFB04_07015 [Terriglobales bacterium]|nr:hypothetical protein [Terriglobales bacterium]
MPTLQFLARELNPWANPVTGKDLKEGSTYFMVNYVDDDMFIPVIETVVFIGRDLREDDAGQVYFQDVGSYLAGIRHGSNAADTSARAYFFCMSETQTGDIFEFESALEELMRCSLKRKDRPGASQTLRTP